jgi:hypothetical protein
MKLALLAITALLAAPLCMRADEGDDPCKALVVSTPPSSEKPTKKDKKKKEDNNDNLVPLSLVVCEVQHALDTYQADPEVERQHALPKLLTADFDFKTVLDTKGTIGISILIFKIGASYEKQTTNDVDFQYEPKSRHKVEANLLPPKNFQEELIDTIKAAAKAKQEQEKVQSLSKDPLVFKQLGVTLSFGVTKDINVGAAIPIHLVTLSPGLDHSKNSVQSVKLVFAEKGT